MGIPALQFSGFTLTRFGQHQTTWTIPLAAGIVVGVQIVLLTMNGNSQLVQTIRQAGLKIWPKRWQNLRATRATELEREFPSHVVTGWCGHTERIAKQHYWMTTEQDFQKAAELSFCSQNPRESSRTGPQSRLLGHKKSPEFPGFARGCRPLREHPMEDNGLEPMTSCMPCKRSPN